MLKGAQGAVTSAGAGRRRKTHQLPTLPATVMEYLQILGGAALIAGGVFALIQFQTAQDDLKIERTLQWIEQFESETFLEAQDGVAAIATRASDQIELMGSDPSIASLSASRLEEERGRLIVAAAYETVDGQSDLSRALRKVVGFFAGVSVCVERRVCDRETAHRFLDPYAVEFWDTFSPVVDFERAHRRPGFAKEMEAFVKEADSQ